MNWIILMVAGLFEVGWAIGLKYTDGFTRLWPTVWTIVAMIISLGLLARIIRECEEIGRQKKPPLLQTC